MRNTVLVVTAVVAVAAVTIVVATNTEPGRRAVRAASARFEEVGQAVRAGYSARVEQLESQIGATAPVHAK